MEMHVVAESLTTMPNRNSSKCLPTCSRIDELTRNRVTEEYYTAIRMTELQPHGGISQMGYWVKEVKLKVYIYKVLHLYTFRGRQTALWCENLGGWLPLVEFLEKASRESFLGMITFWFLIQVLVTLVYLVSENVLICVLLCIYCNKVFNYI